ncbi:MAG: RnfABCDGE type electron transport complex subunit G [Desulfobacteraceae bacterium]|jgi:electron transport complex protein RnfG
MARMIVVLTVIALLMGSILSILNNILEEPIEYARLKFVKGPAVMAVFSGYDNDPLKDVKKGVPLKQRAGPEVLKSLFPATKDGKCFAVAFEVTGKGYGGLIDIMMGIDLKTGHLTGIRVMTHSETPGLGARATEPPFYKQFTNLAPKDVALSSKGGKINAISGATNTSQGVVEAVKEGLELFARSKDRINNAVGPL